jgi:hypothetical protein
MLSNSLVHGKPILLLCNKTDIDPSQVNTGPQALLRRMRSLIFFCKTLLDVTGRGGAGLQSQRGVPRQLSQVSHQV